MQEDRIILINRCQDEVLKLLKIRFTNDGIPDLALVEKA